ncbi:DUF3343 domain-containing protein [Clostridium fallax]|uniref:Putative Se/S carrier protein-like domain-containing protein n=1 Tax=Clostridium fallax TaxID=1533 RepID=A0A1M4SHN4_9CLOT|nr:DUF3343 domain-containing protein [Clostridium fallax]SHE31507.1 Protein of unknown function [Clostridium fallax]SQB07827.1 Protein of uncharacterised function (DUF3343) [Clostridium fallax]
MNNKKYYILFENHTDGMRFSEALSKENIKYVISPTPRKLSVCCGISIMYKKDDEEKIKDLINKEHLNYKSLESIESTIKNFYK